MSGTPKPLVEVGSAPVFFANGVQFKAQAYDFQLDFTLQNDPEKPPVVVATIHLSPQLAKVMARLMRKNIVAYEEQTGAAIQLPQKLLDELGISDLGEQQ